MPSDLPDTAADSTLDARAIDALRALDPGGRNRLLERVARAFDASTERLLPQLRQAHAAGEYAAIRHVAHTLKSSSASVGALELSRTCSALEAQVRDARHDGVPALVEALLAQAEAARRALADLQDVGTR